MTQATIAVEDVRADAVRIAVAGEIDLSNATTVERQVLDAITNQLTEVTLDLNRSPTSTAPACGSCSPSHPGSTRSRSTSTSASRPTRRSDE